MKQVFKPISDFIAEFNLESSPGVVCFEAVVFIYTDRLILEVVSEIHIINIAAKEMDVIYLLNPEINSKGFPDMFEIRKVDIDFKQRKGLLIKGITKEQGDYTLLIQPTGRECEPLTVAEIYHNRYEILNN